MARHIKKGDLVVVISGADASKTGKVLRVIPEKDALVVEGIKRVWKHVKPSQKSPQGGRIQKESPVHISNVMLVDPSSGKGTRVRFQEINGEKHRIAVKGGADLGRIGSKAS